MAQNTLINGNRYSFTDVRPTMAGIAIAKGVFTSINYDATQDPGIVQGNQVTIVGRTAGYATATGSFEMLVSELDDFFFELSRSGTLPLMSIDFNIDVAYSANGVDVRMDRLQGCRITSISSANAQGNDATKKTCNLSIARVILNGIAAFADPAS